MTVNFIDKLTVRRADLVTHAREMLQKAKDENRPLTDLEREEHSCVLEDIEEVSHRLEEIRAIDQQRKAIADVLGPYDRGDHQPEPTARDRYRPLTREQSLVGWSRTHERAEYNSTSTEQAALDFGLAIRGMVTGNWDGADAEKRAMSEGTLSAGGYNVPTPLAAEIIDKARAQMQVVRAGARTVPMDSQTLKIARVETDPAASWHTENAPITATDGTFGQVLFTAQTLTIISVASIELFEDAQNIGETLTNSISQSIALEWDRVALRGSGTAPEPRGVRNQSGVTITAFNGANGGTPTTYDHLIDANYILRAANYEPSGYIMSPRTDTTYAKLKDSTGQPLQAPAAVSSIPRLLTTQVPINLTKGTSSDCSDIYAGQWDQLLLGMRTNLQIKLLDQRYIDNGQFGLFAYMRGDVQLARAAAFNVIEGIRP